MLRCDLHVHTALSACSDLIMSPRRILEKAGEQGLNMLAVTDHNASGHVAQAMELGSGFGICVIPAMEVASREDVHLLAYFPDISALNDFQKRVDASLPDEKNPVEVFGYQVFYDTRDEVIDYDDRLRQIGLNLGLDALIREIRRRNGLAVPAHVYRPRHSLISQLGLIDPAADYDAVEIAAARWRDAGYHPGQEVDGHPVLTGSDAHFLEDVGRSPMELPGDELSAEALFKIIRSWKGVRA